MILASNVWWWTRNLYYWRRSHYKVSGLKWCCHRCPSSGPYRSIESQQDEINLSWNNIGPEGANPDVWHKSLWLQVSEKPCIENGIMVYYWCSRLLRHLCWTGVQLLGQIFQESLTWDGSKTEVGEKRCNLQLVKLEKYSIQGLNSSKQYRIWLVVSTHLNNISQTGHLPQIGVKIKILWNHYLPFFSADLDISECKATKCKPCSPPSWPIQFHDKKSSSQSRWLSMLRQGPVKKKCQTMSNPRAYNAICANIQPRVVATMGNPRKSMNLIIHSQQTEGFSDLLGSFIVLWLPDFKPKNASSHSSISWWFQPNWKYARQIGSFPQVGVEIQNRWTTK